MRSAIRKFLALVWGLDTAIALGVPIARIQPRSRCRFWPEPKPRRMLTRAVITATRAISAGVLTADPALAVDISATSVSNAHSHTSKGFSEVHRPGRLSILRTSLRKLKPKSARMVCLLTTAATASATLVSVASAPGASAAIAQCDAQGPSNYHVGYYYDPAAHADNFEGASGYIVIRGLHTCATDTQGPDPSARTAGSNFTSDFVMIASYDSLGWSQAGEIGGPSGIGYGWAEVAQHYNPNTGDCTDCFDRFLGTLSAGDRDAFTEKFQYCSAPTSGYCVESLLNGARITDTNFDPYTYWAQRPGGGSGWSPQFEGEKTYQASDILGTTSQHANFQFIGAQRYTDDTFENMPCELTGVNQASRATYQASNCYTFDIWTTSPS